MASTPPRPDDAELERVLVLVRGRRDGDLTVEMLSRAGIAVELCTDAHDLHDKIVAGAAAALVAEEVLSTVVIRDLGRLLRRQPPWSDFPIIVFSSASRERGSAQFSRLGNVTFLDRPVTPRAMVMAARAAIRSRRRQYEARAAIEARDTFLAMLGHELRNPLGAIRLALEVQEKKRHGTPPSREQDIVERQSRHLARLVDDLLDVARITHGKISLTFERVNLVDIARGAFDALEGLALSEGLMLSLDARHEEIFVNGDRQRLEQVVVNLVTNAIKYTPRGGRVHITAGVQDHDAFVSVRDSGVGIAPDMLEKVFEVFTQVERSIARTKGGMGLGLSVVRSLVQLHHGVVEAQSDGVGQGSVFTVRLPLDV